MLTEDAMYFLLSMIFVLSISLVGIAVLTWDAVIMLTNRNKISDVPMWKSETIYFEAEGKDNDNGRKE